jgi:glycosyltransferase involved in cell wall biosynthesis
VVQNLMPWRQEGLVRRLGMVSRSLLLESAYDHIAKYKSSANAGRAFVFGYFGIPVVADAIPSTSDAIVDGHSGRLVLTTEGWYDALEELILSPGRRQQLADNFQRSIDERFAPAVSARRLVDFVSGIQPKSIVTPRQSTPAVLPELWRATRLRIERRFKRG